MNWLTIKRGVQFLIWTKALTNFYTLHKIVPQVLFHQNPEKKKKRKKCKCVSLNIKITHIYKELKSKQKKKKKSFSNE